GQEREAFEGLEDIDVLTVEGDRTAIGGERSLRRAEAFLLESGNTLKDFDAHVGVLRVLDLDFESTDELLGITLRLVDLFEHRRRRERGTFTVLQLLQRLESGCVIRLNDEEFAVQVDGALHVGQPLFVESRDTVLKS